MYKHLNVQLVKIREKSPIASNTSVFQKSSPKEYRLSHLCTLYKHLYVQVKSQHSIGELRMYSIFYVTDGNIMYLTDASRFLISCVIQHYAPVVGWGRWRNRCIMLTMTLDPSWIQTLSLPPPGIEPGSPTSQAGTHLTSYQDSLYQCCGSGMFIPDPGS